MPGRCRKTFSTETKLVRRRGGGGTDEHCYPLHGIERAEAVRSERENHVTKDRSGLSDKIAGQDGSAAVLQRNPKRFSGARGRFCCRINGGAGRFPGRHGG